MIGTVLIKSRKDEFKDFNSSNSQSNIIPYETQRLLPECLGWGLFSTIGLHQDMNIGLSKCHFIRDYQAKVIWNSSMITFVFVLSGRTCTWNSCYKKPIFMIGGDSYVHYFQDPVMHRKTPGSQALQGLAIRISPQMFERMITTGSMDKRDPDAILNCVIDQKYFFNSQKMTPQMKIVLLQIFKCPHQGVVRKIYLESKAMELIAYKLEQILGHRLEHSHNSKLTTEDRDSLYLAKNILVKRLKFPPSLTDLAKTVGMSHTRLNRGFRKLFGCTAFAYLRSERLEYARLLLSENLMNITEVAFEAGFCSSSHFASAFCQKFGMTPNQYKKSLIIKK